MLVMINGERLSPADAKISIFDRGFLFGDAIYEVCCTHGRRPFQLGPHLDRLEDSGRAIDLDVSSMRPTLESEIRELVGAEGGQGELLIRIMISRGASPDLDLFRADGPPQRIVLVKPLSPWPRRQVDEGARIKTVSAEDVVGRIAPWVKSNNRQANVMAHRHAREQGFDDGLFVDPEGNISEGPSWNVFCVYAEEVVTPPLERGILPGITRQTILDLCRRLNLVAQERSVSLEEARRADEMFLTSTTRGVMPVAELDGRRLGSRDGAGPVTARLRDAYTELTRGAS